MTHSDDAAPFVLTEHELSLPLDHDDPDGETIDIFAREVAANDGRDRPFLVYLQGGPGQEAPRPVATPAQPSWLGRALRDYRVLMLDQRGTGRSTPFGAGPQLPPPQQADYLSHLRADAIVRDAECFRAHLGVDRWSVLGQSFGGFCALRYLTDAPDSLREAYFTGGLPPVGRPVDEIYAATFSVMRGKNQTYHRRYPEDRQRLHRVLELCAAGEVTLPDGDVVTPRRFRTIGNRLGMHGGAEELHHLLERDPRSPAFCYDLAAAMPFTGRNPLYAVIHESSYSDGHPTRWSAQRVMPDDFHDDLTLLTGEHIFDWHFEDCSDLAPYAELAGILAEHEWPRLYDAEVLASVDVPCAAAVYADDPFVERELSKETAQLLPRMRTWVTPDYEHNGLRVAGELILDRLFGLARDQQRATG